MGVLAVLFVLFLPLFLVSMDRWAPLLMSIITGDKSRLQDDILGSGICESKRQEWAPKPKLPKIRQWWELTPEEREIVMEERRKEMNWQPIIWAVKPVLVPPLDPPPPPRWRRRNEIDDVADELFRELD